MPVVRDLGRVWRNLNRRLSRLYIRTRLAPQGVALRRYGDGAGSWMVPADAPRNAVCYCGGVGIDATFDFHLRRDLSDQVYSFDPTPKAIEYMAANNTVGVNFLPWGLLDQDTEVKFYLPFDTRHQSSFTEDLHGTGQYTVGQCYKLKTIQAKLGHDAIYMLKIDIEGSWYAFILDFLRDRLGPEVLNVEFDSPAPIWRVWRVVRALEAQGYRAVFAEGDNVTFVTRTSTP